MATQISIEDKQMSPEFYAIIGVGVALGVGLGGFGLVALQIILRRIEALELRVVEVEKGQARIEGLVDGLREILSRVPVGS